MKFDTNVDEYSIFSNECDKSADGIYRGSQWIGQQQGTDQHIKIDLQIYVNIVSIDIKNGHNGQGNDRSTKDFRLDVFECGFDWTEVASGTLTNAINQVCENINVENYPVNKTARYVRFVALNYYGSQGSSLQYLHVNVDYPASVVADNHLKCPGNIFSLRVYKSIKL